MRTRSPFFNKHVLAGVVIANMVTTTLYSINMVVLLNRPIISSGFFMPFFVGTTGGLLFGYLYNQRKIKHAFLFDVIEQQKILNQILILSNQEVSLQEILDKTIQYIIKAPFCKLQSKGAIFTKEVSERLILRSHHKLSPELVQSCGKRGVAFGECLCGLAAEKKETIFKSCVDHEHSIRFDSMDPHGHYNVPIIYNDEVLGVIVVYLDVNHVYNNEEVEFLESVANVLAIILNKKSVAQKAQRSESALKEIRHFAGIGTWILNIETGIIKASDEVYSIMGHKPQSFDFTENDFLETALEEERSNAKEVLKKAKLGEAFELELRHHHKNGSIIHIINKCKPRVLENGYIPELTGTIIDVTNLRSKEAELAEKQEIVKGILSATPDPLFLLDLETNEFIYHNKAMEVVLNDNPQIMIDYPKKGVALFKENVHPDDLEVYNEMDLQLREKNDFFSLKFRTKIFGDSYHWVDQKVLVFSRKANGLVKQVIIVSKDITEIVEAENDVKELNEELLTQNLHMKKINAELDQFVYSVSHDLRAPLSSMLGLVNLSNHNVTSEELKDYMRRIGKSVEKLDGFIKDILDYSRNARTEIEAKPLVVSQLFGEIIENIKSVNNPDIELDFSYDEPEKLIGDKRRIRIVLNNILSNAIKYADYNKPHCFLKVGINTSIHGCDLNIEDNGIGINKNNLAKIYDMFYRGTEKSTGSGLGLYIVNEIIYKLGGTIKMNSEEGVGTTTNIHIPHANTQV